MQVTYIPIVNQFDCDSISGRVVASTLLNQNIDVQVRSIVHRIKPEHSWQSHHEVVANRGLFFQNLWSHKYNLDNQIDEMHDIVLMSINDLNYVYVIDRLLRAGKKVLIGGSTIQVWGYKTILKKLIEYFKHDVRFLARNLIAVKGMVDLSTDLKSVIEKWQTTQITENDFKTIYDCDFKWVKNGIMNFVFRLNCPWMKCTFCNRRVLPVVDFLKDVSAEQIYINMNKLCPEDGTGKIVDDYFLFTPKIKDVLDNIKFPLEAQTGIKALTQKQYVLNLNKYIDKIKFGLETTMDYSLRILSKEQNWKMIQKMTDNIIQNGDPEKLHFQPFWIIDSPQKNEDSVRQNYDRLMTIRQRFIDKGFKFTVYSSFMGISPDDPLCKTKHFGYETAPGYLSGTSLVKAMIDDGFVSVKPNIEYGLVRYDENGHKMRSDIDIIDNSILDVIFDRRGPLPIGPDL